MPCCTLIAFVLSQFGLGAGAARVRFLGRISFAAGAQMGGWKALGLAAIAGLEILLASAALPLIATEHGRNDTVESFNHVWRICSVQLQAFVPAAPHNH